MLQQYHLYSETLLYITLSFGPIFAYGILIRPKNDTLTGIQGWLAWLATGQVLSLLYNAVTLYWDRQGLFEGLGGDLLLYTIAPMRIAVVLAQAVTTYALFARKTFFAMCVLVQSIIAVAVLIAGPALAANAFGVSLFDLPSNLLAWQVIEIFLTYATVLYTRRSRRVANTMIR